MRTEPKLISLMENRHLGDMYMKVRKAMKQFKHTGSDNDAKKLLYGTYTKWYKLLIISLFVYYLDFSSGQNQYHIYSLETSILMPKIA